jgi:hypothetical protein
MSVLRCCCMKAKLWKYRGRVQYLYDTILHLQSNARALRTFMFCKTYRLSVPTVGGDQWDKRHRMGLTVGGLMPVIVTLLRLRIRGVILLQEGAEGRRYPKADRWLTKKSYYSKTKCALMDPRFKKRENNTYRRESSVGEVYGYRNRRDEQTWWTRGRRFFQVHLIEILCSLFRKKIQTIFSCMSMDLSFRLSLHSIKHLKGKTIPLQSWTGPEDSTKLRLPDFKTIETWRW